MRRGVFNLTEAAMTEGDWVVRDPERDNTRTFQSRSDAEDAVANLRDLGVDAKLTPPGDTDDAATDGGQAEVINSDPDVEGLPERSVSEDPITWMPEHFVDTIQGTPVLNRKAYCVIAERYGVAVTAEPITLPAESEFTHAVFRATAVTREGREYSGIGSAHVDRGDGDDAFLLAELAETRAMKRACAWATGLGITAVEEMRGEL